MIATTDFIKEKYIKLNKITQEEYEYFEKQVYVLNKVYYELESPYLFAIMNQKWYN